MLRRFFRGGCVVAVAGMAVLLATAAHAQKLSPISVTGFNQDVVFNGGREDAFTTSYFDIPNLYSWYAQGVNTDAPDTGLPTGGHIISLTGSGDYQLESYTSNNVLLLAPDAPDDRGFSVPASGTLTFTAPHIYSQLGVLVASANGDAALDYTIHYVGGTTDVGQIPAPDWFGNVPVAYAANGRILDFTDFETSEEGPRLYEALLSTDATKKVSSVDFTFDTGGNGEGGGGIGASGASSGVFAISGLRVAPEPNSLLLAGFVLPIVGIVRRRIRK